MAYNSARGVSTTFSNILNLNPKREHNHLLFPNYAPNISALHFKPFFLSPSSSPSSFRLNCRYNEEEGTTIASAFAVLGVQPGCSSDQLKAAFRAKVKEFHPDVRSNQHNSDLMIRRVIQAYEILSNCSKSEIIESECLDPFDNPECEALDVFVNEVLCIGKGCPYSCVKQAPHAFMFSSLATARATSQGHAEDYRVQLAVGQCPRSCIYYVTHSQRIILEELLDRPKKQLSNQAFWILHMTHQQKPICFTLSLSKPNMRTTDTENQRSGPKNLLEMLTGSNLAL